MRVGSDCSYVVRELAQMGVAIASAPLAPDVARHVKRVVLDWCAATLPGAESAVARAIKEAVREDLGHGRATVIGDARRASARTAALINGTSSHVVEFDDIFREAIYHPGSPIVAAALALAETRQVSGETFLRAILVGYELSIRIGISVQPAHYKFWHTTGTVGSFGAAAAGAVILGLDADRFAHALAKVGTFAAGLQQAFRSDTMSKPMHAGRAAEAGILAALAAEQEMTGALDILEGPVGFGAAMAGGQADWSKALSGLGKEFLIGAVTIKIHGCCAHSFPAIDGALNLQKNHRLAAKDVKTISVGTYATALDIVGRRSASSPFEGRFCLPFVVSSALVHGSIRLDAFTPERLSDPLVLELMSRFDLALDPELNSLYPEQRTARVCIQLHNGQTLEHLQMYRRGDPEEPISDEELQAKFDELVSPILGRDGADHLARTIWHIDQAPKLKLPLGIGH